MHDSGRTYFENRVLTASPAKLQWMLLDAATKSVRTAESLLTTGEVLRANVELAHAESILSEVIGSMRKELNPELVTKSAAVYAFILRRLTEAHLSGEVQPVRDALRVLDVELETWRLLGEQSAPQSEPQSAVPPAHIFSAPTTATTDVYEGGFSLDA